MKRTVIVAGGVAAERRLQAARAGEHGLEVRTIAQVAQRLAGGFLRTVDGDTLVRAAEAAICATPDLGDLAAIADLPGLPAALAGSLNKAWLAGIDLAEEGAARAGPRLATMARLERAVLDRLPPGMLLPADLTRHAVGRLRHALPVLGPVTLDPLLDVAPCWRPLLDGLPGLCWQGRAVPSWWGDRAVAPAAACTPTRRTITCATARHEVIEAMRWARGLLASGNVQAGQIAIAAASPGEYDDLLLAISAEASLDVHFGHGRRAVATRDGQAAAALADLLLHGLSQDRVRRLARLAHADDTPLGRMPEDWLRTLPRAAPLPDPGRWRQAAAELPVGARETLLPAVALLAEGTAKAAEAGELFLRGTARLLWRRALLHAPATALDASLGALRLPDATEAATSIGWMHAATLACCPRPHVWLLGLNARTWPRNTAEDPLLPGYVIQAGRLDPFPVTRSDRDAFHAICATTAAELVCSASRRDATGRLLGLSPLLAAQQVPERLARTRIPAHAMSEQDRMMARPAEFAGTARASSAHACWQDWNNPGVTPHDGAVRPDHPAIARALARVHSATSLKALLRNPIGFTWHYALGWREPDAGSEPMELDAAQFGSLVHAMLDAALRAIAAAGGLNGAGRAAVIRAVAAARAATAAAWEEETGVPPAIIWALTLDRAEAMAVTALCWPLPPMLGASSHAEVAFGGMAAVNAGGPWDSDAPVVIPGTTLHIQGRIDRLDLSGDGLAARLVDYKTGWPKEPGVLNGGRELQRCLYGYVVQALLGPQVRVEAALLFPKGDGAYNPLADTAAALRTLAAALLRAEASLRDGNALFGPDTGGEYDDLAFALPAGPGALTGRKREAAASQLGDAALIWEEA
jgi:RecB family exonuclease